MNGLTCLDLFCGSGGLTLGIWEPAFHSNFHYGEFAIMKSHAGLNRYKISVKEWVEKTNAIGLKATAGNLKRLR
jgi:hypothetical protein